MEGSEAGGESVGTGVGEDGGELDGRRMDGDGAGREDGGERDGRRMGGDGLGGKIEGSETGGAWRMGGTGWGGKMEGSETGGASGEGRWRKGRWRGARREARGSERGWGGKMQGSETGGAWVGTRLGREDGGERDGSWRGKMEGSETGARKHRKHHCRLLWGSAKVERSMGGGSAAPCFAEARWEVSGARCLKYHSCHEAWRGLMLRFGLLICVYFSWAARFFLLLGPRTHLVFSALEGAAWRQREDGDFPTSERRRSLWCLRLWEHKPSIWPLRFRSCRPFLSVQRLWSLLARSSIDALQKIEAIKQVISCYLGVAPGAMKGARAARAANLLGPPWAARRPVNARTGWAFRANPGNSKWMTHAHHRARSAQR